LLSAAGEADIVALVSEEELLETRTPPVFSSSELSELSSEDELELLELEESGSGVFVAFFRTLASAFLVASPSESESEESEESDSESELELEELLELESESEEESELELEPDEDSALETLAFFVLGASSSDSESELESEELLDSALRFTPVGFLAGGAGVGAAESSSSSSASLSELDEAEEEEGDEERDLGASPMLTSESLASLSLSLLESESLSLSELLLEPPEVLSRVWKSSTREGAFLTSALVLPFFFSSAAKAVLVAEKPLLERKDATAPSNWGGRVVVFFSTCP
jgi:hypothetical protein